MSSLILDSDYLLSALPLIASHLIFPPLSYFLHGRTPLPIFDAIYEILPDEIRNAKYFDSLAFDVDLYKKDGLTSRVITYLCVHVDYQHLLNNLFAGIQFAYPIYKEFGTTGMYFLYISGGIISVLPSSLYNLWRSNLFKDFSSAIFLDSRHVPQIFSTWWNSAANQIGRLIIDQSTPLKYVGSSGAVFALMGADVVLLGKKLVCVIYEEYRTALWVRRLHGDNKLSSETPPSVLTIFLRRLIRNSQRIPLLFNVVNVLRSVHYLSSEIGNAFYGNSGRPLELLWNIGLPRTNHVAHIQGALFGMAFAGVFGVILPYFREQRRLRRRLQL